MSACLCPVGVVVSLHGYCHAVSVAPCRHLVTILSPAGLGHSPQHTSLTFPYVQCVCVCVCVCVCGRGVCGVCVCVCV